MARELCLLTLIAALAAGGCASIPSDVFRLSETALEARRMQTREYRNVNDAQILSASSAVLQDLGYAIDEVEQVLGVLSASKRADARNDMETFGNIALDTTQCLATL